MQTESEVVRNGFKNSSHAMCPVKSHVSGSPLQIVCRAGELARFDVMAYISRALDQHGFERFVARALTPGFVGSSWSTRREVGFFTMVFYVSLVQVSLTPLLCYEHPNGELSVTRFPHVLCNGQDTHTALTVISVFALLNSLGFLSYAYLQTIQYPQQAPRRARRQKACVGLSATKPASLVERVPGCLEEASLS